MLNLNVYPGATRRPVPHFVILLVVVVAAALVATALGVLWLLRAALAFCKGSGVQLASRRKNASA